MAVDIDGRGHFFKTLRYNLCGRTMKVQGGYPLWKGLSPLWQSQGLKFRGGCNGKRKIVIVN
jgi:hypothetical protein